MTPPRLRKLRTGTAAMIFQDPRAAINPLRRIGDFLTESLRLNSQMRAEDATAAPRRCSPRSASPPTSSAATRASSPAACSNAS